MIEWHELAERVGYTHNLVGYKILVEIWNLIGNNYEILQDNRVILVQDDIDELVSSAGIKVNLLSKPWRNYKTKYRVMTYSEWEKERKDKQKQILTIQRNERLRQEKEQQDFTKLDQLQREMSGVWWDEEKVKKEIGVSSTTPFAYYYWTLINGQVRKTDWKNNMSIDANLYSQIMDDTTFITYSGKNFLTRCHKNSKGYSCYIEKGSNGHVENKISTIDLGGIYGMYKNGELYYIGLTTRPFQYRWQEHLDIIQGKSPVPFGMILYNNISINDTIEFKPLIQVKDILSKEITLRDLEAMELGLITMYHPEGNYQGRLGVYRFSEGCDKQVIGAEGKMI